MQYQIDHDYHIHSQLSLCSNHPEQTPERLLQYALENGLRSICVTNHFWDETVPAQLNDFYRSQPYSRLIQSLPLPQDPRVRFLFGCEVDMDLHGTIGLAPEHFERFDFVIIPTTHLHMADPPFTISAEDARSEERRAYQWVWRLEHLLNQSLPFHKIGIAHLTCSLISGQSRESLLRVLQKISTDDMTRLFRKAAAVGVGIELNAADFSAITAWDEEIILRPYRIAKACGCRFYLGGDAHQPRDFQRSIPAFSRAIQLLDLRELDKFHIV